MNIEFEFTTLTHNHKCHKLVFILHSYPYLELNTICINELPLSPFNEHTGEICVFLKKGKHVLNCICKPLA